jgi:hypothetical protein
MTDATQDAKPEAVAPTQATGASGAPGLAIADLQVLMNVIDLASSRGAFRAAELSQVGAAVDKLKNFLQFIAEQQKAKQEAEGKAKSKAEEKKQETTNE